MNQLTKIAPKALNLNIINVIPEIIFRYVKPSHVSDGTISDEAFQLRENRSPPEEFISFYYSSESELIKQLKDVEQNICSGTFKFSNNGGLLCLSTVLAKEEVNATRDLIKFVIKPNKKFKIGMHYLSKDPTDIIEAKTTLAFLSEFHPKSSFENIPQYP